MFSTGQIRWCLWGPLVLLALVSNSPSKAQGQGKYYFFSSLQSLASLFASHYPIPLSSPRPLVLFLFPLSTPSNFSVPLSLHPLPTLAIQPHSICSLHHSSLLSSLKPHLSDLLYLHILLLSFTWPLCVFSCLVSTSFLSLSSLFDVQAQSNQIISRSWS